MELAAQEIGICLLGALRRYFRDFFKALINIAIESRFDGYENKHLVVLPDPIED